MAVFEGVFATAAKFAPRKFWFVCDAPPSYQFSYRAVCVMHGLAKPLVPAFPSIWITLLPML